MSSGIRGARPSLEAWRCLRLATSSAAIIVSAAALIAVFAAYWVQAAVPRCQQGCGRRSARPSSAPRVPSPSCARDLPKSLTARAGPSGRFDHDATCGERERRPPRHQADLAATLARGKPHERATAAGVVGQKRLAGMLPELVGVLGDDYPLVRFFAKIGLERATGQKLPLDMHATGSELVAAGQRWLELRDRGAPSTAPQASGE